jgi:hypothetical protein
MPVRPLVTSAPLLGRRRAQCSRARDLLGARHPLVHAVDDMRAMVEHSIVVATMLTTSVSALLAGVSKARAAVAAALVVQVAVTWRLVLRASAERDVVSQFTSEQLRDERGGAAGAVRLDRPGVRLAVELVGDRGRDVVRW